MFSTPCSGSTMSQIVVLILILLSPQLVVSNYCPSTPSQTAMSLVTRVVVSYIGKNYFRNFLAFFALWLSFKANPGICEGPGENLLGEIIFESDHIYAVLNDLEVSRNVI